MDKKVVSEMNKKNKFFGRYRVASWRFTGFGPVYNVQKKVGWWIFKRWVNKGHSFHSHNAAWEFCTKLMDSDKAGKAN